MTSDSEAEYKYSSSYNVPVKTAPPTACPAGELRCVNGNCITISQLCDKVWVSNSFDERLKHDAVAHFYTFAIFHLLWLPRSIQVTDCPDGADEAMCVHQNWGDETSRRSLSYPVQWPTSHFCREINLFGCHPPPNRFVSSGENTLLNGHSSHRSTPGGFSVCLFISFNIFIYSLTHAHMQHGHAHITQDVKR